MKENVPPHDDYKKRLEEWKERLEEWIDEQDRQPPPQQPPPDAPPEDAEAERKKLQERLAILQERLAILHHRINDLENVLRYGARALINRTLEGGSIGDFEKWVRQIAMGMITEADKRENERVTP